MNKETINLKEARNAAIESMEAIRSLCVTEEREKTEDEGEKFDGFEDAIHAIDEKIAEAERMEILTKSKAVKQETSTPEEKAERKFDGGKFFREVASGRGTTGLEKEMEEEGRKSWGNKANDAASYIPEFLVPTAHSQKRTNVLLSNHTTDFNSVVDGLDVNTSIPLYEQLGATIYRGLTDKLTLNFSTGHDAAFPGETTTVAESSPTRTTGVLEPLRVGGFKMFSNEFLHVAQFMPQEIADMSMSVDRAINLQLMTQVKGANIASGHGVADSSEAMTYLLMTKLQAGLEIDDFRNISYVMSAQLLAEAKGVEKISGSGNFIIDPNGGLAGYPAVGTTDLPLHNSSSYDVIWGDWSRAYVSLGSGIEILVDPYTYSHTGTTRFVFNRIADTTFNALGFQSMINFSVS
jgi:HK97 family phage major capsid protein